MLTIRPGHIEHLTHATDAAFAEQIRVHLQKNHGTELVRLPKAICAISNLPDGFLQELIQKGIRHARRYGFSRKPGIASYVVIMFLASPNFDDHPNIKQILTDSRIHPDSKFDWIWEITDEADWDAVNNNYDPNAWIA